MKKILVALLGIAVLLGLGAIPSSAQTSGSATVGFVNFQSGSTVPTSCPVNGTWFQRTTDGTWFNCINGAYTSPSSTFTSQVVLATNYGVKADTRWTWTATTTLGSNSISCPNNDCNFTSADNGKICFATNANPAGFNSQKSTTVILPQGTLTVTGAQTATCSGGNATTSLTGAALFVWGSDDSSNLASAWSAAQTVCGTLQLPGVNSQGNGPGAMLVQSAQFNTTSVASGCTAQVGGSRHGLGVRGININSTFIIPTPNFDFATCPTVAVLPSCFLSIVDGGIVSDLSIWGAGNSNPGAGLTGKAIALSDAVDNAVWENVSIMGWGANATNGIGFGLVFGGGEFKGFHINVDGAGQTACRFVANAASAGGVPVFMHGLTCWDTAVEGLWVDGQSAANVQPFVSIGGSYGSSGGSSGCLIGISGGGIFTSIGDMIGNGQSSGNGVCVGYAQTGTQTGAGTANFQGSTINVLNASGGQHIFLNGATNHASMINTLFKGTAPANGAIFTANNAASYFQDLGGNDWTGVTGGFPSAFKGSGTIYGSQSLATTALTTGGVATTSGWGTGPSVAVAAFSNSISGNFTITVGTTPGANPVAILTFPVAYLVAPHCSATQIGGTQTQAFVKTGTPTTTSVAFTWVGTPTAGNTIQIAYSCWN